jgi:hypothetical protein
MERRLVPSLLPSHLCSPLTEAVVGRGEAAMHRGPPSWPPPLVRARRRWALCPDSLLFHLSGSAGSRSAAARSLTRFMATSSSQRPHGGVRGMMRGGGGDILFLRSDEVFRRQIRRMEKDAGELRALSASSSSPPARRALDMRRQDPWRDLRWPLVHPPFRMSCLGSRLPEVLNLH